MPIDFNDPNIQGALRSNNPVMVGKVPVMHIPFSKITSPEIGYSNFSKLLGVICISEDQYKDKLANGIELSPFELLCILSINDSLFKELLESACSLFFGRTPFIDFDSFKFIFYSDSTSECPRNVLFEITKENFNDVVSVIKKRNGILQKEDEGWNNPSGEMARRIIERRNEIRKKRSKLFKDKNVISIWDYVDIYASATHQPYSVVMDLDIYQVQTQIERLKIMDDYEVAIQCLVHGAKNSDVKLKHWIRKIDVVSDKDDDTV